MNQEGQTVRLGGKGMYDLIYDSADYFPKNAIYRHSMDGFEGYSNKSPAIKSSTGSGNQIIINEAICKSNTNKGHSSNNDLRYETPKIGGKGMYDLVRVAQRGRDNGQQLEQRYDGKTNTLTTVQKDNYIVEYKNINGVNQIGNIVESKGYPNPQRGRIYGVNGKSPTLNTCGGGGLEPKIPTKTGRIRRLTPTECARLQTVPDWYEWGCSDTQQYKMLGNGWTVDVIAHILSFLNKIES